MSGLATAVVAGAAITSYSANKASKRAAEASDAAMGFEQEKYNDWLEVYGPLQENLADYYTNLTPEYYETVGLEAFEQEYQTSVERLDQSLVQRGIDPASGISASLQKQNELDAAETRAEIRRDAPRMAAEDQRQFLQIGLGQNPGNSLSNALQNRASQANKTAAQAEQAVGKAIGSAVSTAGKALYDYNNTPAVDYSTANAGQPYIDPTTGVA